MRSLLNRQTYRFLVSVLLVVSMLADDAFAQQEGSDLLRAAIKRHEASEQTNTRIVGGEPTSMDRNPWQIALLHSKDSNFARAQFCGGVVIHSRWVLTAAHCVDQGTTPEQIVILSETHALDGTGSVSAVDSITVHPKWQRKKDFDIALVRVKSSLKGPAIAPATSDSLLVAGTKIWVSGWGLVDKPKRKTTTELQGIRLDYIDTNTCTNPLSYRGQITDNMFCAGVAGPKGGGGGDSCEGDSGGPASVGPVTNATLVGLVSWGAGCAVPYKYGVYTKVSRFLGWVKESTGGEVPW